MRGPARPVVTGGPVGGGDLGEGLTCPGSSRWTPALLSPRALGCLPSVVGTPPGVQGPGRLREQQKQTLRTHSLIIPLVEHSTDKFKGI